MPYNRLKAAKKRAIGTKQTTKAVAKGEAAVVYKVWLGPLLLCPMP